MFNPILVYIVVVFAMAFIISCLFCYLPLNRLIYPLSVCYQHRTFVLYSILISICLNVLLSLVVFSYSYSSFLSSFISWKCILDPFFDDYSFLVFLFCRLLPRRQDNLLCGTSSYRWVCVCVFIHVSIYLTYQTYDIQSPTTWHF